MKINTLIQGCLREEKKAQYALYKFLFQDLMRTAFWYLRDEQKSVEVINDAFFKLIVNLKTFDTSKDIVAWAKKITSRCAIDKIRREKLYNEKTALGIDQDTLEYFLSKENKSSNQSQDIENALLTLSIEQKRVFHMFFLEGFSHKDIAQELSISERSSKRYLSEAKKNMKEKLSAALLSTDFVLILILFL